MSAVVEIFEHDNGLKSVLLSCPGCGFSHAAAIVRPPGKPGPVWKFNDNAERPTLSPSLKVTVDEYGPRNEKLVCHSFITDGEIRFLRDCTHKLAGQTVPLKPIDSEGE